VLKSWAFRRPERCASIKYLSPLQEKGIENASREMFPENIIMCIVNSSTSNVNDLDGMGCFPTALHGKSHLADVFLSCAVRMMDP
jgi:hypothetical protein